MEELSAHLHAKLDNLTRQLLKTHRKSPRRRSDKSCSRYRSPSSSRKKHRKRSGSRTGSSSDSDTDEEEKEANNKKAYKDFADRMALPLPSKALKMSTAKVNLALLMYHQTRGGNVKSQRNVAEVARHMRVVEDAAFAQIFANILEIEALECSSTEAVKVAATFAPLQVGTGAKIKVGKIVTAIDELVKPVASKQSSTPRPAQKSKNKPKPKSKTDKPAPAEEPSKP